MAHFNEILSARRLAMLCFNVLSLLRLSAATRANACLQDLVRHHRDNFTSFIEISILRWLRGVCASCFLGHPNWQARSRTLPPIARRAFPSVSIPTPLLLQSASLSLAGFALLFRLLLLLFLDQSCLLFCAFLSIFEL
jgi:hypothetical protein